MELLLQVQQLDLLSVALLIVGILIGIVALASGIVEIILLIKYYKYNNRQNKAGFTGFAAAKTLVELSGMSDVQVKKAGFFRSLILGNHYDSKNKTIYLRKNIIDKKSITSVGLAIQKVGLAAMDKEGNKKLKVRSALQPFIWFAPALFLPIILIGVLVDALAFNASGLVSIIGVALGFLFYIFAFVSLLVTIPVEKMANKKALEIMEQTNFLDAEERQIMESVFNYYIWNYVLSFILTVLRFIEFLLKILAKAARK